MQGYCRGSVLGKRYVGIEAVADRLHGGKHSVGLGVFDFDIQDVAPEVATFDAEWRHEAFERQFAKGAGLRRAVVLPVGNAVAVSVGSAERDEAKVVDGKERVDLPIAPDEAELVFARRDLGKEEERIGPCPVRRGDDLTRHEEPVDIEREVKRRRFRI